jgi:cytochrome c biogenesis protein CcmG/thiol:disulfide interchange protein DsbE
MKNTKLLIPSAIVLILLIMFLFALQQKEANTNQSPLQGKQLPAFSAPSLLQADKTITEALFILPKSKDSATFSVLNVWASWCVVCKIEHPYLMQLSRNKTLNLVGLNYRDQRRSAVALLDKKGNPYKEVIYDNDGRIALNLGVLATPETYLIDNKGIILFRHTGDLNESIWLQHFQPLINAHLNKETAG